MAEKLKTIYVIHTTSKADNAKTNADFRLIASRPGMANWQQNFPDLAHDERESGRSDEYRFDVAGQNVTDETQLTIAMITTENAWLPQSIWAIGETEAGQFKLLAAHPQWNRWFDRGAGAVGQAQHRIDN